MTIPEAKALKARIEREVPEGVTVKVVEPPYSVGGWVEVHNEGGEVITYFDVEEYSLHELCALL